jgi:hypothetical protein
MYMVRTEKFNGNSKDVSEKQWYSYDGKSAQKSIFLFSISNINEPSRNSVQPVHFQLNK